MALRHLFDLLRRHIPRNNQDRIIRRIELLVILKRIWQFERFHLMTPTNHRHAVAMVHIKRCTCLLTKQRIRIILCALIAFFYDHFALGQNIRLCQAQIHHSVRFHLHHQL